MFLASWMAVIFAPAPWICVAAGVVTAIFVLAANRRHKDTSVLLYASGWVVIGIVMATWNFTGRQLFPFLFLASGMLSLLTGAISLLRYLYQHPMSRHQ